MLGGPEFDVSQILDNLEQLEVCIPYSLVENSPIPNSAVLGLRPAGGFRIPNSGCKERGARKDYNLFRIAILGFVY